MTVPVHNVQSWDSFIVVITKVNCINSHHIIHSIALTRRRTLSGRFRKLVGLADGELQVSGNLNHLVGNATMLENADESLSL